MRQPARTAKATTLTSEPGVAAVCWCGRDVCTFDEDDHALHRHRRSASRPEVLAEGVEALVHLACDAHRVAWTTPEGTEQPSELHVVLLP